MAIRLAPSVPSLNTREYFATEQTFLATRSVAVVASDCSFCLNGCTKDIPVFADLIEPQNRRTNDFSSYIAEIETNNTIVGTLIQLSPTGVETLIPIVDSTYGAFYDLDVMRSRVWGFILDWNKVLDLLGGGKFKFNIKITNQTAVVTSDLTTPCYNLKPFTCERAHGTVRIETEQTGYIEDGFDYRNLVRTTIGPSETVPQSGWPQQIRWYGNMFAVLPTLLTDNIVTSFRESEQVQAQYIENYELKLIHIQTTVSAHFFRDNLLANKILISDYTRNNPNLIDSVRISPLEITDRKTFRLNKNEIFTVSLEEYTKDTLKRN